MAWHHNMVDSLVYTGITSEEVKRRVPLSSNFKSKEKKDATVALKLFDWLLATDMEHTVKNNKRNMISRLLQFFFLLSHVLSTYRLRPRGCPASGWRVECSVISEEEQPWLELTQRLEAKTPLIGKAKADLGEGVRVRAMTEHAASFRWLLCWVLQRGKLNLYCSFFIS